VYFFRYENTFQFQATVPSDRLETIRNKIAKSYHPVIDWEFGCNHMQMGCAGLTRWDDRIFFTLNAVESGEEVVLKFEVRASSLETLVVVDRNRKEWVKYFDEQIQISRGNTDASIYFFLDSHNLVTGMFTDKNHRDSILDKISGDGNMYEVNHHDIASTYAAIARV